MAPKSKATAQKQQPEQQVVDLTDLTAAEEIQVAEDIAPQGKAVTFEAGDEVDEFDVGDLGDIAEEDGVDEEDVDDEDEDEGDEDDDDDDEDEGDELTVAVGQLAQLFMTEDGEAITDVLGGIRDALDKQNKILYRGLQLLEQRR